MKGIESRGMLLAATDETGTKKKVVLISMSEFTPDKIMNFYYVDAFVELACPRIALDDFYKYSN